MNKRELKNLLEGYFQERNRKISKTRIKQYKKHLKTINDIERLMIDIGSTEKDAFIKVAGDRIAELLKVFLPGISDIKKLIDYRCYVLDNSDAAKLIEGKIAQMIAEVSIKNIPEWFRKFIDWKSPRECRLHVPTPSVRALFKKKAEELLRLCSSKSRR